jgi:integrase
MRAKSLLPGTQIAVQVRGPSIIRAVSTRVPQTIGDLLNMMEKNPPSEFSMLRTTCSLIAGYLEKPVDELTIDSVANNRDGFRSYLECRKYARNSIRSYVNYRRILLKAADRFGWKPNEAMPDEWRNVIVRARFWECKDIVRDLARVRKKPQEVTIDDVDNWVLERVKSGHSFCCARQKRNKFWRLLNDCGCTDLTPLCVLRRERYGVPLKEFPPALEREVNELLRWKRAEYSPNRPKNGRHREVTSKQLQTVISGLYGFAINVRRESKIASLPQLFQARIVTEYLEWSINERKVKGCSLQSSLRRLFTAMHQHPKYSSINFSWFKPLMAGLPVEPMSESRTRKQKMYSPYEVVESIPAKIRADRKAAAKRGIRHIAWLVATELLMKWLVILPWRQRNIRECRISGAAPNIFRGRIPSFSEIEKPEWVKNEEGKNPDAEFWQFRFSADETKMGTHVEALLPRQLIGLLEEYLKEFRPHLIHGDEPETLFVSQRAGEPMASSQISQAISAMTIRYAGTRVTPHLFRDIVAYTWLKEHPTDYLTLSKMLWHSGPEMVIRVYGRRFNVSNGVSAMESWLDGRERNHRRAELPG